MCGISLQRFFSFNKPLFFRNYIDVQCNRAGEHICHESCIGLNLLSRIEIEENSCRILENGLGLYLSLSTRICGQIDWLYSGFTITQSICCAKGRRISCAD
ncbi:hypothetical protein HHI36_006345 [Cryptolaemus montrouzieri]